MDQDGMRPVDDFPCLGQFIVDEKGRGIDPNIYEGGASMVMSPPPIFYK